MKGKKICVKQKKSGDYSNNYSTNLVTRQRPAELSDHLTAFAHQALTLIIRVVGSRGCLDHSVLLAYVPNPTDEVRLYSENFDGLTHFKIHEALEKNGKHWSNYARGAVFALKKKFSLRSGIDGIIQGNLSVGGLSSSATVGLAYLFALEQVNEITVSRTENIDLDQVLENEFIGLHNGI
jgi:hypothetical protein